MGADLRPAAGSFSPGTFTASVGRQGHGYDLSFVLWVGHMIARSSPGRCTQRLVNIRKSSLRPRTNGCSPMLSVAVVLPGDLAASYVGGRGIPEVRRRRESSPKTIDPMPAVEAPRVTGHVRNEPGSSMSTAVAKPTVLVFMGVSGCGKTTVAAILAGRLGWPFEEGDALHPQSNIDKMKAGHPLTDDDRWPWLEKVAEWVEERLDAGENGLITCSALKRSYRDIVNRRVRASCLFFCRARGRPSPHGSPYATATSCRRACSKVNSPISRSPPRTSWRSGWISALHPA